MKSAIYIVATPIGNLSDISYRAVEILSTVDLIAAEDTRHTARLLAAYDIKTPMISMHEHNEHARSEKLIASVSEGQSVALVSDAGTPLISDPGSILVEKAREAGLDVVPIPGASALIAALSASGMSTGGFLFDGFPSAKSKAREVQFESYAEEARTIVLYESPHRILDCLGALAKVVPLRKIVLARELTKTFETFLSGTPEELILRLEADPNQRKGEFVVLIAGAAARVNQDSSDVKRLIGLLLPHVSAKTAAAIAAEYLGGKRNDIYKMTMELKGS